MNIVKIKGSTLKEIDMKEKKMDVVDNVIERCKAALGENLVSIILFGSPARGLEDNRSDIDILLVVNEDVTDDFLKDIRINILLTYSIKLDTICMNKEDVIDNFEHFSPLFLSFVLGVSLLVDNGVFKKDYRGCVITHFYRKNVDFLSKIK